ncbi:MAG: acetylglutamate kinase, partial [Alphaproteobacteria bacterium]|nr:acetylglutamate kinase [Alphaproteobacteria bacterium]
AGSQVIPVIAPIGSGRRGETFNINADTVAGALAGALRASKLIMLTDVAGVMDGKGKLAATLTPRRARGLLARAAVTGGMIPKLETCLAALKRGTGAAHILDGRVPHAVLLEVFTAHGVGTMIEPARRRAAPAPPAPATPAGG